MTKPWASFLCIEEIVLKDGLVGIERREDGGFEIMKKIIAIVLSMLLCLQAGASAYGAEDIKVYLDGEVLSFDTQPQIVNGRTMVPVRMIFEALGMALTWEEASQEVTATKPGLEIKLVIGSNRPKVNGETVFIDANAYIDKGRTMVPLRFIAEATGAEISWDGASRSAYIVTGLPYAVVDTGLTKLFSSDQEEVLITSASVYYGQDGQVEGHKMSYTDNKDGSVSDHVTGLTWQKTMAEKMTYDKAVAYANASSLGGYEDWRLPTIKELYSLIDYNGTSGGEVAKTLYINTTYFDQPIGDTSIGEREIDAQTWSATKYVGLTMQGDATVFGVNFIDGRIKGYALIKPKTKADNTGYFRLVRGNTAYGKNNFVDNGDGTISDLATGLMWQVADDGKAKDWPQALDYSKSLSLGGYNDWRLPNAKELQSIVDYTRSPSTSGTPAIDPLFSLSSIKDPEGQKNYGYYWSSTTHQDGVNPASSAVYVAFGDAQGQMNDVLLDVHGAGAVRSDPKTGLASLYPTYFGPQGDVRYVYNYVLSVRNIYD